MSNSALVFRYVKIMNVFICGEEFSKKSTIKSKQLAIVVV